MNNINTISENFSTFSVVAPDLSHIFIKGGSDLDSATSKAFVYADKPDRKLLFALREALHRLFPDGTDKCNTFDDCLCLMSRLSEISATDIDTDPVKTAMQIPGILSSLYDPSDKTAVKRFLHSCGKHITLCAVGQCISPFITDVLSELLNTGTDKSIAILVSRRPPKDLIELIAQLWEQGIHITVCSFPAASVALGFSVQTKDIVLYDGRLMIAGKTALTCISVDAGDILSTPANGDEAKSFYGGIKKDLEEIIKNEVVRRFRRSKHGQMFYRKGSDSSALAVQTLLYPKSIGSENDPFVRGIFEGGADYDIISVSIENISGIEASIPLNDILRYFSSACRVFDRRFPIKALPFYRDTKFVFSLDDISDAIRNHCNSWIADMQGGAVLEIVISKDAEIPSQKSFSSLLSGFFGLGGMMLRVIRQ